MTDPVPFNPAAWHAANVGLPVGPELAALLFPHDSPAEGMSMLTYRGKFGYVSTCALYAMAYCRAIGLTHPDLDRGYFSQNTRAPQILQHVGEKYGAWSTAPDDLLTLPVAGDVIAVTSPWHAICVTGSDGPTGALDDVAGGGGDGRAITRRLHQVTTSGGKLWLHDPAWGSPRAIVGRLVASRLG